MSSDGIKCADLAKELEVKTTEVVTAVARLRGAEYTKGIINIKLSSEEAEQIRNLFIPDLFGSKTSGNAAGEVDDARPEAAVSPEPEKEADPPGEKNLAGTTAMDIHTLEVKNLLKIYGKRQVVKEVSLSVNTGEIVGLLGPNGAGKTTTFYMVVGLIKPEGGDILLDGNDLSTMPMYQRARRGIGYLPQEPSIFRKLTVRQNLEAVLEIADLGGESLSKGDLKEEIDRLLEEFNLTEFADRDGYRLSGGERRRTEIARAIAVRPTFMLFDEPFAGIDPIAIIELKKMLSYLRSKGLGILITDHNVRETLSITDRAYIINNGAVLAEGSPDEIISNPAVKEAYLGEEFRL